MKKYLITLLVIILASTLCKAQLIKGSLELNKDWNSTIYILKVVDFKSIKNGSLFLIYDSVKVNDNGTFEYTFKDNEFEGFYRFNATTLGEIGSMIGSDNHFYVIPSRKLEINLSGKINKLSNVKLSFSDKNDPNQELYEFTSLYEPLRHYYDSCEILLRLDSSTASDFIKGYFKFYNELNKSIYPTLTDYKSKYTIIQGAICLMQTNFFNANEGSYEAIKSKLLELDSNSNLTHTFINFIEAPSSILNKKVEFKIKDINNNVINIDSIHSKYILIDFWASWCTPCRKKNKSLLKELHRIFPEDQLCIISISCDKDKQRWIDANIEDNITWISVCDFKGPKSKLNKDLSISSYPTLILLNENKMIIRNDLGYYSDEQVIEDLKALFNN